VPIVLKRRVQFSRIDPAYARELFIRHALVEGDVVPETMKGREWDFDRANRALRTELAELEERTRRRDILFDDEAIFEFYNRRLPADVASTKAFEGWWRKERQTHPDLLTMTAENLVDEPEATVDENAFPSVWQQGDQRLALTYRFEPGADDDGVTVNIPIALLASLRPDGFDWQVPGFREELVTALIKTLPKEIRRNVVPAGDWARKLLAAAAPSDATDPELARWSSENRASDSATPAPTEPAKEGLALAQYLADEIRRQTYTPVDPGDFDVERVPPHLRVTFAAIDERGRVTASSKVLSSLQLQLKSTVRASVARASVTPKSDLERTGLTTWDFDELPRVLDTKHGSGVIRAYPSLVDEGKSVAIRLQSTPDDQARAMRAGVRRMLLLAIPAPTAYVQQHLTAAEKLSLATSPYRSTAELFADCMAACIDDVIGDTETFTRAEFEGARDRVSATIVDAMFSTVAQVSAVLVAARAAEKLISQTSSMALLGPLADAREQLGNLVYPGFVSATGTTRLRRIPVYLAALAHRITRLADNLGRDRVWLAEVQQATERYVSAGGDLPLQPNAPEHLRHARWMLEELRVGLFAQHLPTAEPVSLQRITKVLGGG
jgi:ATP-dependent helicase HrpA